MPLADIYVLDQWQSFNGKPIHNIWTFERLGEGAANVLINAFQEDLLVARIQPIQCSQIKTESIKAYSLGNLLDLSEETIGTNGGITGEMLPPFNAINFSLKPTGRVVRPGSKRFAGVPEAVQVDGTITDSAYITALNALRTAMGNYVSVDDENFWQIVIVKRIPYHPEGTPEDHVAYRFPETDEELVYQPLRNVLLNTKVTSQVSRKD